MVAHSSRVFAVAVVAALAAGAASFTQPAASRTVARPVALHAEQHDPSASSRRDALFSAAGAALSLSSGVWSFGASPAAAKGGPATPEELARIKTGYERLSKFLDNFDKETTVCRPECERAPDAVRSYLGLRSTTDPLFQIDKVFSKAQDNLDDIDELEGYIDATEAYISAVAESNSLSYTSSFGEYNPGGGKDEVVKYLLKSKNEAIKAQTALKQIIDILKI